MTRLAGGEWTLCAQALEHLNHILHNSTLRHNHLFLSFFFSLHSAFVNILFLFRRWVGVGKNKRIKNVKSNVMLSQMQEHRGRGPRREAQLLRSLAQEFNVLLMMIIIVLMSCSTVRKNAARQLFFATFLFTGKQINDKVLTRDLIFKNVREQTEKCDQCFWRKVDKLEKNFHQKYFQEKR